MPTGATPIKRPIPVPNLDQFTSKLELVQPGLTTPTPLVTPITPTYNRMLSPSPYENRDDTTASKPTSESSIPKSKIPKFNEKKVSKIANKENVINASR